MNGDVAATLYDSLKATWEAAKEEARACLPGYWPGGMVGFRAASALACACSS